MGGAASKTTEDHGGTVESILGSAQLSGESDFPHSSRDAVAFFELASDIADPTGMCNLADCLMNGWGVERDPWEAYDLYRRAAEAPHYWRPAMHCVALCHRHGEGLEEDEVISIVEGRASGNNNDTEAGASNEEIAFEWFRRAASTRETSVDDDEVDDQVDDIAPIESMHQLGLCYLYGIGTKARPRRGVIWLNRSAIKGYEPSKIALRNYYSSVDLAEEAINVLDIASSCGEVWAINNMGVIAARKATKKNNNSMGGKSKTLEEERASMFYLEAEDVGVEVGVTKEQEEARKTAQRHFLNAIGENLLEEEAPAGEAAPASAGEAPAGEAPAGEAPAGEAPAGEAAAPRQFTKMVSNSSSTEAMHNLGVMYVRGWCPPHDAYEGMCYIHRAAELGLPDAVSGLATCYLNGHGVTPSLPIATRLFREAALLGSTEAQSQIARSYLFGQGGMLESPRESIPWLKLACEQGRPEAQALLGAILIRGLPDELPPVKRKPREGVKWLRAASEAGNYDGCHSLSECYEFGVYEETEEESRRKARTRRRGVVVSGQTSSILQAMVQLQEREKQQHTEQGGFERESVAKAARKSGWEEADQDERKEEERRRLQEEEEKREKLMQMKQRSGGGSKNGENSDRVSTSGGSGESSTCNEEEDKILSSLRSSFGRTEAVTVTTQVSPLPRGVTPDKVVVAVNLIQAQKYRERGMMIGDALKSGEILNVNDGFSFAVAAPKSLKQMDDEEEEEERKKERNKNKEERKEKKRERKEERRRERREQRRREREQGGGRSINRQRRSSSSSIPPIATHGKGVAIITPRREKRKKKKKKYEKEKPRKLPIPPLPTPVTTGGTISGWTDDHDQWQGPQGPGIPGFGMAVFHSGFRGSQGAYVPAAKSSVFPWGGNTVSEM